MIIGGIEAGGTKFVCAVGNEYGEIFERISFPTEEPEIVLNKVLDFFKDKNIQALGIGSFGPIDLNPASETYGFIKNSPKLLWKNFNLLGFFKNNFNIPISIDTDVNVAALGEKTWGAAQGLSNCVYLTVGTGIGGGIISNGKILHGINHSEMGHIYINKHSKDDFEGKCPFHKICLEGLASGPAIEKRWNMSAKNIPDTHLAWELEAYYIAQALVNYLMILAPEKIILGGGIMKQTHLFPKIREQFKILLNDYIQNPKLANNLDEYIVPPKLEDNAGVLGAIALTLKN